MGTESFTEELCVQRHKGGRAEYSVDLRESLWFEFREGAFCDVSSWGGEGPDNKVS